jgi:hypothetical protein
MWGLWWTKQHWGRFSPSTFVSPANHSTNFSITIITRGWHSRPISGRSAEWAQLNSTPHTIQIKRHCFSILRRTRSEDKTFPNALTHLTFHFDEFLIISQSESIFRQSKRIFLYPQFTRLLSFWACLRVAFVIREITYRQLYRSEIYGVITHRIVWQQFLLGCFPNEYQQFLSFRHQSLCRSECVGSWGPVMVTAI